jgi:virginiamycin A acetyltransferase
MPAVTYGEGNIKIMFGTQGRLSIGKACSIAPDITVFLGGNHRTDWITTYPFRGNDVTQTATKGDVVIGNDVWIGQGTVIMSGVTIGNGVVIAAYSVVTKNVPAYAVVAGNPAEVKKLRFTLRVIEMLEEIAWWDWPDEKLQPAMPILQSNDVEALFQYAKGVL